MNNEMIEQLKKWKFLEEYRAKACLDAACSLEEVDEEFANELYISHEIHLNNAFECEKLLRESEEWLKECDKVINEIESGDD